MAKAQELKSIKLLSDEAEDRNSTMSETDVPDVEIVAEAQGAPEKETNETKRRRRKVKTNAKGICSKSPIVRLLKEEKSFLKRLEAHILLETGETVSDHQLIMDAVREYTKKHYPDF